MLIKIRIEQAKHRHKGRGEVAKNMDTRGGVVAVDNNLFLTYYSLARNCQRGIFEQAA